MSNPFDGKAFCLSVTSSPGVYQMLNSDANIIYVGKAKNLKKRLSSYFSKSQKAIKTVSMVAQIASVEVIVTNTEAEALVLEDSLIKSHRPKYNILMRDDKSYPYVQATMHQEFPKLTYYRGRRKKASGEFFGPYPAAYAVRQTISTLQKVFKIRSCEDSYFKHRTRPCLQYQINRCSAPCVDLISKESYLEDMKSAVEYLRGDSQHLIAKLVANMDTASTALNFEDAAKIRDQINLLRELKQQQVVTGSENNIDILAVVEQGEKVCVGIVFVRDGRVLGNKVFFPKSETSDTKQVLNAFIIQYYLDNDVPHEIVLPFKVADQTVFTEVINQKVERSVEVKHSVRGQRAQWLKLAELNTKQALVSNMGKAQHHEKGFQALRKWLQREEISLIECFDISHTQGEKTVASCTCFNTYGALKERYRRFNISGITPGDDYAAMHQAVKRHFARLVDGGQLPEILLIDGGPNQVAKAVLALEELGLGFSDVTVIGIAKGPTRKLGDEELFINDSRSAVQLPKHDYGLRVLQAVRDEAHRFAVTGHRSRREKARKQSTLEAIPGLGPKRRQSLLKSFGGLQGITAATEQQLASVQGISQDLAKKIYVYFHGQT